MPTDLDELERLARDSRRTWFLTIADWSAVVAQSTVGLDDEDIAYIAAASPDVILSLTARVRAAEAEALQARGRVSRLKALVAQTAAGMARNGLRDSANVLVRRADEIMATDAAPEDFVTARHAKLPSEPEEPQR